MESKEMNTKRFKSKRKYSRDSESMEQRVGLSLKRNNEDDDPFSGPAPLSPSRVEKYKRGKRLQTYGIITSSERHKYAKADRKQRTANETAARSELLLNEEAGFLEADTEEFSFKIKQKNIADVVDITSATNYFDLKLSQFSPYQVDFSRNGRNLLLGGSRGHVAAMDWVTKKLLCEINVMESVHDITWLHMPTMFAVAQKRWTHVYDNQGVELHCVKKLDRVLKLEFLPYHFLLVAAHESSFLSWLDISIGQLVTQFSCKSGRLDVMCQNPLNAIICTGHPNGTVNLWSPNVNTPLVKMLCHNNPVRALAVDNKGLTMATASVDKSLKIWDLRTYKCMQSYRLGGCVSQLCYSQQGLLAASIGNLVEIYQDVQFKHTKLPYLQHSPLGTVSDVKFCPYEDVLGIGHARGYSSIIVPGAGEPNFDALESNPYMTKSQRREMEIKSLLEKIQPDMITLNPKELGLVNEHGMKEQLEQRKKQIHLRTPIINFDKKQQKMSGIKKKLAKEAKRNLLNKKMAKDANLEKSEGNNETEDVFERPKGALDRFAKKKF